MDIDMGRDHPPLLHTHFSFEYANFPWYNINYNILLGHVVLEFVRLASLEVASLQLPVCAQNDTDLEDKRICLIWLPKRVLEHEKLCCLQGLLIAIIFSFSSKYIWQFQLKIPHPTNLSVISRCPWQRILHIPWIHMTLSPWEYVWEFPPQILTSTTNSHRVSTQIQIEFAAEKKLSRNRALLFEYKVTDTTISQHIDTVRTSITLPLFMIRFVCVCACVCACVCVRVCACVYVYVSLALALALSLSSSLSLSHFLSLVLSLSLSFSLSFSLSISLFLWVQSTTKEYETSGSRVRISSTCPLAPSHAATHMHTNYMQEWTDKYAHRLDK